MGDSDNESLTVEAPFSAPGARLINEVRRINFRRHPCIRLCSKKVPEKSTVPGIINSFS